jgi:hypothetical protein
MLHAGDGRGLRHVPLKQNSTDRGKQRGFAEFVAFCEDVNSVYEAGDSHWVDKFAKVFQLQGPDFHWSAAMCRIWRT